MTDGSELLFGSADFRKTFADWQAIRIIRDNYMDAWRLFFTIYTWFFATMAAVVGYILSNHPFKKVDAHLIAIVGTFIILLVLFYAVFMAFLSKRCIKNVRLILATTEGADFFFEKVIHPYAYRLMTGVSVAGVINALFCWNYLMYYYYERAF